MLFNSQVFVFCFLPLVLAGYYALARYKSWRQGFVVLASLVFYGWWDVRYLPLLAGLALGTWLIALAFGRWRRGWIPLAGVTLNLAALGVFKYADFLGGSLAGALWRPWHLVLPLGISFFVFQKISYLIDLRRGDRHIYRFLDFAMFVTFFPQLIAGPLVRHNEIIPQFAADPRRAEMWQNLSRGLVLFVIGVAKKVALADTLATLADPLFARAGHGVLNLAQAWTAAGAYTLQIYFDFSGYSDMAIGLGLMFGLTLPVNFDAPYRAISIRDFWRRWHITLSRFLRDYLYIPLGGSRCPPWRQTANLVATMLLGGLWHGASWTFVAWGGLHGLALAAEHGWNGRGLRLPPGLGRVLTLLFVLCGWVLFRAADFPTAGAILAAMAGGGGLGGGGAGGGGPEGVALANAWVLPVGAALALLGPTSQQVALVRLAPRPWLAVPAGLGLVFLLLMIGGRLQSAFIYFQF